MSISAKRIFGGLSLLAVLLLLPAGFLHAQAGAEPPRAASQEKPVEALPDLADIIPQAGDLAGRLAQLQNNLNDVLDTASVDHKFATLDAEVDKVAVRLQETREANDHNLGRLVNLSQKLKEVQALFVEINRPLAREIRRISGWQAEWLAEKKRWREQLPPDQEHEQLKLATGKAIETIDTALDLILAQLDGMLQVQAKGSAVKARIDALDAEAQTLLSVYRRDYLLAASLPMFSPEYLSQFSGALWQTTLENMEILSWPDKRFFAQHGWPLSLQFFFFLAVILTIYRNRQRLNKSARWQIIAARPLSAGFFVVILTQSLFPQYRAFPVVLRLVYIIVGGISFSRILGRMIEQPWKKQAARGVITLFVIMVVLVAVSLPLPLYRLYTLLASLLALCFLVRWVGESVRQDDAGYYPWILRLGAILCGFIAIAQLWGKEGMAGYLFKSSLTSLSLILAFALFISMIRGGLLWVFSDSPVWEIKLLRSEAELLARRTGYLVETVILVFVLLPMILAAWDVYESMPEATTGLLSLGFDLGSQRVSVGLVTTSAAILYGSLLLSRILPRVLLDEKVAGHGLERGARISVGRLIQYFIIFIGFLVTLTTLGLDFTKLTIILSALGVGIGFGLQGIVNNFISGLILLFEQPVRVGDSIEVEGKWAEIKRIGLRSTVVQTVEKADVIIPNADLVSKQVINWTLGNRQVRLAIPVGVAYGSDVPLVMETLAACAKDYEMIAKSPPPQVLFMSFGESSLNFELRVWVTDADNRLSVRSDLHETIVLKFREANIQIAFPQRDLHLRSVDSAIVVTSAKNT